MSRERTMRPASDRPGILVVSPTPPPYSGLEVMTRNLLDSPLRERFKVLHYNVSKGRPVRTKARFDLLNLVYGLTQPLKLIALLRRHRPQLVYTNLAQNLAGFLRYASFILVASLFRQPIAVRVMGDGFHHFYVRSPRLLQILIRSILARISVLIVRSGPLKRQFDGLVPLEKVQVVHSGIPVEQFQQPHRGGRDPTSLRILFVGYLTKAKGAHDLLHAVPEVVRAVPNAVFRLMGENVDIERNVTYIQNPESNRAVLAELLRRPEIRTHVELLGVQTGEEKMSSFLGADLFVLPSYAEATPLVVLEAMAAEVPVVATPVGLLPEVFDQRGIAFVEPGDRRQLAETIVALLQDEPRRRAMAAHARGVVESYFSLEAYARRVQSVLEVCLKDPREGRPSRGPDSIAEA